MEGQVQEKTQVQESTQGQPVQEQSQAQEQTQQAQTQVDGQTQEQSQQQTSEEKPQEKQSGSGAYTLQHNRPDCIGCAACEAVAPEVWEMNEDSKSDIKGGKDRDDGWQELDFEEKDLQLQKDAADSCPVNVIHIVKKETGEKLI